MTKYKHQKGVIEDNAIEALLHDPLFRQRIEMNIKGKGSYRRNTKHKKGYNQEGSDKDSFITVLLFEISETQVTLH